MYVSSVVYRLKEDEGEEGEGADEPTNETTTSACLDGKIIAKKEAKPCSHQTSQPHPPSSSRGKGASNGTILPSRGLWHPTPDWTDVRQGGWNGASRAETRARSRGRWTLERGTEKGDTVPLGLAGYPGIFSCHPRTERDDGGTDLGRSWHREGREGRERGSYTRSITTTKRHADDPASNIDMLLHPALEYPATAGMLYRRRNASLCPVPVDLVRYGRTGSCLYPLTTSKTLGIPCVCIHSLRSIFLPSPSYKAKYIYRENASCPPFDQPSTPIRHALPGNPLNTSPES